ncbi:MAG TPA: alpha/beta hydrolase [Ilumatobacteraceae bacterium]|nr:alpha/beta hydrolase [Ilumatobacteraceae bacterium]
MPIDPQVESLLSEMAALGGPPIHELSVAEARTVAEGMAALAGDPIEVAAVDNITIPVDGAEIGARVYTPEGAGPHPVVMFFHGGGWVICSLDTHDNVARAICRDAEALVVSVDYRMAPEHRFPTAAHDCFAATKWVAENASSLGGDAGRLAVCGDSAGGNLSAVVSQMARDEGGPAIAYAALIYPAVDMTRKGGSLDENASGYFLETEGMEWFMNHYLTEAEKADVLASPLLHSNLAGLPDTFIATCEYDPLRDEGEAYGDALRANGVHVENKRYKGLIHGAANMTGVLDGGRQLVSDVGAHLRGALHH